MPRRLKTRWILLLTLVAAAIVAMAMPERSPFSFVDRLDGQEVAPINTGNVDCVFGPANAPPIITCYAFQQDYWKVKDALLSETKSQGWKGSWSGFEKHGRLAWLCPVTIQNRRDDPSIPSWVNCYLTIQQPPTWLQTQLFETRGWLRSHGLPI